MKLAACVIALAAAKKVPLSQCKGSAYDPEFVDKVKCNRFHSCKLVCKDGATAINDKRRFYCKKSKFYIHRVVANVALDKFNTVFKPAQKDRQACIGCDDLSGLVKKGVNVDGNLVFCRDSEILSSFGTRWVDARCDCNKATKKCSYKDSHGQDIQSKLKSAFCQSVNKIDQPSTTGPRMPPGLTCTREDPTRIVGGQVADPNTWPWMVQLEYDEAFTCGGVIVGENLVLTGKFKLKLNSSLLL